MKKLLTIALSFLCLISLFFVGGRFAKTNAETLTGAKLEYFELSNPLCAVRDGEVVYIAEKQLLVIYNNDTYHKIDLTPYGDFTVKQIAKCGNYLFALCDSKLFALDLATYDFLPVSYPANSNISFENIDCFAVNGNRFVIFNSLRDIFIFELNEGDALSFDLIHTPDQASDRSDCVALTDELNIFYHSKTQNALFCVFKDIGTQGSFKSFSVNEVECFDYDGAFYYKANDVIYSLEVNLNSATPTVVVDLTTLNIQNSGDFFVSEGKILICDTQKDRIVEYDISANALTSFEISFTKINLPSDFEIAFNANPNYVNIAKGVKLYDINLEKSQQLGYFSFNGYHTQISDGEYLVVATLGNDYYLLAGEVTALVLQSDFTPTAITQTAVNSTAYLTTNAKAYLQPRLTKDFASFALERFAKVEVLNTLTLAGVEYSLIKQGESVGYIPSTFLVSALKDVPEYNSFKTANVTNKTVTLYLNEACEEELEELPAHTQVMIIEELESCYKVIYGEKVGYLLKEDIQKRGSITNKRVTVIVLLAIAVFVTAIFFEKKYVFNKKKSTIKPR